MPDPYVKQTWIDGVAGGTPISAARLAYIEDGIENAAVTTNNLSDLADADAALSNIGGAIAVNRPVNLWDEGADPTGVADASAVLNVAGGRQVDIPTGTYKLGSPVVLPAGTTWKCEPGVTFLADFDGSSGVALVKVTQVSERIDGSPTIDAATRVPFALEVTGGKFGSDGLTLTRSKAHGGYIHNADDVSLENLRVVDCGSSFLATSVGFYVSAVTRLKLQSCHAQGSFLQGFYLSGSAAGTQAQVSDITATSNGGTGLDVRIPGATVNGFIGTDNLGSGFALNLESTGISTRDTVLCGINCYENRFVTGLAEINLASAQRVVAIGLKAHSTLATIGLRLNEVDRLLVIGALIQGAHSGYLNACLVPAHGVGVTNADIYGSSFENFGGLSTVFQLSGVINGLKVASSTIKGGNYGVTYGGSNDISNTDFRFFNSWGTIPVARYFRELTGAPGSSRLPAAAPVAATGTDATTINTIRTDLINAGFYK